MKVFLVQSILLGGVVAVAACLPNSERVVHSQERMGSVGAVGGDMVTFHVVGMMKTKSGAT